MNNDAITIEEPVYVRFYTPGGRGGYGFRSTRWHRLVARGPKADYTACGEGCAPSWHTAIKDHLTPRTQGPFALCPKCWPEQAMKQEQANMSEAHAEGLHDEFPREFCPECKEA